MNTTLQVRISKQRKEGARKVLQKVGLDLSSGVNLFLEHVITTQSVPFTPTTTEGLKLRHWKEYKRDIAWAKKHSKRYATAEEAFADILK